MYLKGEKIVTFSTNRSYQNYATVLVKSLRSVFKGTIICRCVNCDDGFLNLLSEYDVIVIEDNITLNKNKKLKNPTDTPILKNNLFNKNCLCDDEITYTCHSRFYNAKYIFENYNFTSLVLMDCDFIIQKSFDELFQLKEDILIMDKINCVHEDCIVLKNTTQSREFINRVIEGLEKNIFFWDQDTIALKNAFNKGFTLEVGGLDLKYKDYTLSDSSSIWSGDGHAKYKKKFVERFNEILLS